MQILGIASQESEVIFDLDTKRREIETLEKKASDPELWNDPEKAREITKKLNSSRSFLEAWENLNGQAEDAGTLLELAREENDESLFEEIEDALKTVAQLHDDLELKLTLSEEYDQSNALLSIHPGAGGLESQDWAEMLLRMYTRWAERSGFQIDTLNLEPGEGAGIKSATLLIKGDYSYGKLRSEKGVHRLVRISPFDSNARRHTSFASVDVFPEITEDIDVQISDEDIRVDTYRASGAGGQHVNKTSSAIRITHFPSNIVVTCQTERSQISNRETAMMMLKSRLYDYYARLREEEMQQIKGEKKDNAWGSQIRSYTLQPYCLIKDHRTSLECGNVQAVLDGDIDQFIHGYLLSRIQE